MTLVGLFSRNRDTAPAVPLFAYCEPVWATPTSAHHIRRVGEEGLKVGGGIPNAPLCGRESIIHGRDLSERVTPQTVLANSTPRDGDGRVFMCAGCADAYNALPDSEKYPEQN